MAKAARGRVNSGVYIKGSGTLITSKDGDISIKGQAGSNGDANSDRNAGIYVVQADITSTGTGSNAAKITLDGTGGAGDDDNYGVFIASLGTEITSNTERGMLIFGKGAGQLVDPETR